MIKPLLGAFSFAPLTYPYPENKTLPAAYKRPCRRFLPLAANPLFKNPVCKITL
jgi:hypothetical protein